MKPLAAIPSAMRRSGIREVMEMAAGLPNVIHLEVGEPDFNTPEPIIQAAFAAARAGFTKYTPNAGLLSLRQALVGKLARENGLEVGTDSIVVTAGAVEALAVGILACVNPGDEVLVPDPGWPNYTSISLIAGATPVSYPLDRSTGFLPDFDALERLVTPRTKLILTNSPANPTGTVFDAAVVQRLVQFAHRHDLYVISDEVYEALVFDGEHVPAATFDPDGRVITVFGASKTYAMTGWRLGYAVASPGIASVMAKLQEPIVSCASSISQKAAEFAFSMPQEPVAEMREAYRRRRDVVVELLGPNLASIPQGAFYALVDVSAAGMDSYAVARSLLSEEGLAIAPGETFGPSGAGLVRISLATAQELLEEGCRRLLRYLERHASASAATAQPIGAAGPS
jgi:aspartate/methionine/tyrosine aminotransferase